MNVYLCSMWKRVMLGALMPGICWVALSLAPAVSLAKSSADLAQAVSLVAMRKMTIGPSDHLGAQVDVKGEYLYFVRSENLAQRLMRQNLKTGQVETFLSESVDRKDPVLSPDASHLAYVSFADDARGDICFVRLIRDRAQTLLPETCFSDRSSSDSQPFWLNDAEVAFVSENVSEPRRVRLRSFSLESELDGASVQSASTLVKGAFASPSASPDGRLIVAVQSTDRPEQASSLVFLRLQDRFKLSVRLELPGRSAFPRFSKDGRHLYFSQFFSDTNRDRVINGSDHGILFRLDLSALDSWFKAGEAPWVYPEQLTSVSENCSFPVPGSSHLYTTCAFEGSLDIYRLPLSGVVPAGWQKSQLSSAYRAARRYQDRLLVLNHLIRRRSSVQALQEVDPYLRLVGNFSAIKDQAAALFYLRRLQENVELKKKLAGQLAGLMFGLEVFLSLQREAALIPPGAVPLSFRKTVDQQTDRLAGATTEQRPSVRKLQPVLRLYGEFLKQTRSPVESLDALLALPDQDWLKTPIGRAIGFQIYDELRVALRVQQLAAGDEAVKKLLKLNSRLQVAAKGREQEAVFYAYQGLGLVDEAFRRGTSSTSKESQGIEPVLQEKIQLIEGLTSLPGLPEVLVKLYETEKALLRFLLVPVDNAEERQAAYKKVNEQIQSLKDRYHGLRAALTRATLLLNRSADADFLGYIASDWTRYAPAGDSEFAYARENSLAVTLDHAYRAWAKEDLKAAARQFFASMRATDDFESHYGYITSFLRMGLEAQLDKEYDFAQNASRASPKAALVYAEVIRALKRPDPMSPEELADRKKSLKGLLSERSTEPLLHQLIGFLAMNQLLDQRAGLDLPRRLGEEAHKHFMLAYDLGRSRLRVRAPALVNLGVLHLTLRNYGLAYGFLKERDELDVEPLFPSVAQLVHFRYLYARSLYYTSRYTQAAQQVRKATLALKKAKKSGKTQGLPPNIELVLLEKQAFYLVSDADYPSAGKLYEEVLRRGSTQKWSRRLRAKLRLSAGFCFFQQKNFAKARVHLAGADRHLQRLAQSDSAIGGRGLVFQKRRLQLLVWGFMAQIGEQKEQREAFLEKRLMLIDELIEADSSALFPKPRLSMYHFKDQLQWMRSRSENGARLDEKQGTKALASAKRFLELSANPLSVDLYRGLRQLAAWRLLNLRSTGSTAKSPSIGRDEWTEAWLPVFETTLEAYDALPTLTPVVSERWLILMAYRARLMSRVEGQSGPRLKLGQSLKELEGSASFKRLSIETQERLRNGLLAG